MIHLGSVQRFSKIVQIFKYKYYLVIIYNTHKQQTNSLLSTLRTEYLAALSFRVSCFLFGFAVVSALRKKLTSQYLWAGFHATPPLSLSSPCLLSST